MQYIDLCVKYINIYAVGKTNEHPPSPPQKKNIQCLYLKRALPSLIDWKRDYLFAPGKQWGEKTWNKGAVCGWAGEAIEIYFSISAIKQKKKVFHFIFTIEMQIDFNADFFYRLFYLLSFIIFVTLSKIC